MFEEKSAGHHDRVDIFRSGKMYEHPHGVGVGADRERAGIDDDQVRHRAGREAADVGAAQSRCAGQRRRIEHGRRRRCLVVAVRRLAHDGRHAHFGKQVEGIGISGECHVHAGFPVAIEAFQGDAAPREGDRGMGDRCAGLAEQANVVLKRIAHEAVPSQVNAVGKDRIVIKHALVGQKLNRRARRLHHGFEEFTVLFDEVQGEWNA